MCSTIKRNRIPCNQNMMEIAERWKEHQAMLKTLIPCLALLPISLFRKFSLSNEATICLETHLGYYKNKMRF